MTKEEAQQQAQVYLKEAREAIMKAENLADQHRFTMDFLDKEYCPRDITEEEKEEGELPIGQFVEVGEGGCWQSSSDMC
jgi:hypothetical protein